MIKILANTADHTDIYCVQMLIGHYQVQIPPFTMHMDAETACQGQRSARLCLALYPTICVLLQRHMQFLSTAVLLASSTHWVGQC